MVVGLLLCAVLAQSIAMAQRVAVPPGAPAQTATDQAPAKAPAATQSSEQTKEQQEKKAETDEEMEGVPALKGKRRDPFHTLIEPKKNDQTPISLPPGKKGLVIEQLQLLGIARAVDGSWIAVVDNKTKRAYFLHQGDQLYNGVVTRILPDRVIFAENVPDMGRMISREVVKRMGAE